MCKEYDGVLALQTNISMGDLWLKGMAEGAASSNRTVQYCMPYAHDIMSAAAYPAVTNARATGDCALILLSLRWGCFAINLASWTFC